MCGSCRALYLIVYYFRYPYLFAPFVLMLLLRSREGMWCVPEERPDCRRILNVTFGSRDGRGVCVPPSRYAAIPCNSCVPSAPPIYAF